MMKRTWSMIAATLVIGSALAACSDDDGSSTSTSSSSSSSSSSEDSTETSSTEATGATETSSTETTGATETSPTEASETSGTGDAAGDTTGDGVTYEVGDPVLVPDPLGDSGANGSGCSPGPGDLPDGMWFGVLAEVTSDAVEFDLACWFTGDAANEAAAADGETEIPVPNDYYIRDESPTLRTVPVDPEGDTWVVPTEPSEAHELRTWSEFVTDPTGFVPCPGESCLAWLYVNDGRATAVVTQYTP